MTRRVFFITKMSERRILRDNHPKPTVIPKLSNFGELKGVLVEKEDQTFSYGDKSPGTTYSSGEVLRLKMVIVSNTWPLATIIYEDVDESTRSPIFNLRESAVTLFFNRNGKSRMVDLNGLFNYTIEPKP